MKQPDGMTPDWVMLGVPHPDGTVCLYASTSLTRAELEYRAETDSAAFGFERYPIITSQEYTITAVMDDSACGDGFDAGDTVGYVDHQVVCGPVGS